MRFRMIFEMTVCKLLSREFGDDGPPVETRLCDFSHCITSCTRTGKTAQRLRV